MRWRLLVGLGTAIIVLATVVVSLALTVSGPSAPTRTGGAASPALMVPAPGVCPVGAQQCGPVIPQGDTSVTTATALVGALVVAALTAPGRTRLRRRRRSGRLAAGIVPTLLHPPRVVLTTH
jgi:hypothetical protein